MNNINPKKRRNPRSSVVTIIISISLVLFILGIMGLLILNAKKLSDYIKENIGFSVILNDDTGEAQIKRLQKLLDAAHYVKTTRYITKEEAEEEFQKELGEDFVDFIGYNPLLASIEVKLNASYANTDSIKIIEKKLSTLPEVNEVYYQKNLIHLVNENIRKISTVMLIFSVVLLLISFTLINSTIRLSIFSHRFIINTMQLVGSTDSFVRRPFINRSIFYGFMAAIIAVLLILAIIFFLQMKLEDIIYLADLQILIILTASLIIIGIAFAWIATHISVNLYLHTKTSDLY